MEEAIRKSKIICHLWTDMIGPSIYLGELAAFLSFYLHHHDNRKSLKILDLFSGSGAVALSTINKFRNLTEKINLVCVDQRNIPISEKICKSVVCIKADVFNIIKRASNFFQQNFDIIVSDPPHYLTLDLLYSIVGSEEEIEKDEYSSNDESMKSFIEFLSKLKTNCMFLLYYSHKEQERLGFFIIRKLGLSWPEVFNITIADEKIALCTDERIGTLLKSTQDARVVFFDKFHEILKRDYQTDDLLVLDKYNGLIYDGKQIKA